MTASENDEVGAAANRLIDRLNNLARKANAKEYGLPVFSLDYATAMCILVADLLRAWELRGLEKAARLMCGVCAVGKIKAEHYENTDWWHRDGRSRCAASPIHDEIAREAVKAEGGE